MKEFLESWAAVTTLIILVGGIIAKVVHMLYKKFIKDPLDEVNARVTEQGKNYNQKFKETHAKIEKVSAQVSMIQVDASEIKGAVNILLERSLQ